MAQRVVAEVIGEFGSVAIQGGAKVDLQLGNTVLQTDMPDSDGDVGDIPCHGLLVGRF